MHSSVIFYTSCVFLVLTLGACVFMAWRGNRTVIYFLWVWAAILLLSLPLVNVANLISPVVAALILVFFLYVLFVTFKMNQERIDISHEETRLVLAESNRRIDEERRNLARTLHDEVNPQLLLTRTLLEQLQKQLDGNERASAQLASAIDMVGSAYTITRDLIKHTRIEVIDSIGFTAAIESLVAHYASITEKPVITLEHNLPKRPPIDEATSVSAYKIIRECIFNAIKHANATRVDISIELNESRKTYAVKISDDGIGIQAPTRNDLASGIGMIDMRERVRAMGGNLKIQETNPENRKRPGTEISFSFSAR